MASMTSWFIYAFLFGVITAYIAKKKRNTDLGFILGFLFGIFATIVYLFLKKK